MTPKTALCTAPAPCRGPLRPGNIRQPTRCLSHRPATPRPDATPPPAPTPASGPHSASGGSIHKTPIQEAFSP